METVQEIADLNRKLDILLKLLAYQTVGNMTLTEGAPLLKRLGFTQSEIAAVYGTNANVISVRLAEAKRKSKKE